MCVPRVVPVWRLSLGALDESAGRLQSFFSLAIPEQPNRAGFSGSCRHCLSSRRLSNEIRSQAASSVRTTVDLRGNFPALPRMNEVGEIKMIDVFFKTGR
jgi:hypothetical protein